MRRFWVGVEDTMVAVGEALLPLLRELRPETIAARLDAWVERQKRS